MFGPAALIAHGVPFTDHEVGRVLVAHEQLGAPSAPFAVPSGRLETRWQGLDQLLQPRRCRFAPTTLFGAQQRNTAIHPAFRRHSLFSCISHNCARGRRTTRITNECAAVVGCDCLILRLDAGAFPYSTDKADLTRFEK